MALLPSATGTVIVDIGGEVKKFENAKFTIEGYLFITRQNKTVAVFTTWSSVSVNQ